MLADYERALVCLLATLDQISAGVEVIHSSCINTRLESCADEMREKAWEMLAAVEVELDAAQKQIDHGS